MGVSVYRFPHSNYYLSLFHLYDSFWQLHPYFFVHFLNVFSFFFIFLSSVCSEIYMTGVILLKNVQYVIKID